MQQLGLLKNGNGADPLQCAMTGKFKCVPHGMRLNDRQKEFLMQFQFNSDNQIDGTHELAGRVEEITRSRLAHIEHRLTRVEVHISDIDGPRSGGEDKKSVVEIRPAGMAPISAVDQATSVEAAVSGATDKVLAAFDRQMGKRTDRKGH